MFAQRQLTELRERKRLLMLEADLHRALVVTECASVRQRLNEARNRVRSAGPWLALGAGAAGVLAARRFGITNRWIPAAFAAWRWLRRFKRQ